MRRVLPLVVLAAALTLPAVGAAPGAADSNDAGRAAESYAAMEHYFYVRAAADYRERIGAAPGSHAWPFSQALAASIAVRSMPQHRVATPLRARFAGLERRLRVRSVYTASPHGALYLDDNEWLAQDFLDWSDLAGGGAARARAAAIFAAVVDAWDDVGTHPCSGGVFWMRSAANRDRNTVSTANGALVGLRLYAATGQRRYLTWAKRMLAWVDACMLAPDGLYWDHIDLAGTIDRAHWSYNQGSVIGADVLLYTTTGEPDALLHAEQLADVALAYFANRWLNGEPPEFAAIFFRNLLTLAALDGRQDYVAAAESYGDSVWTSRRDGRTGLFSSTGKARLLTQAALVQLYAALARQPATASP